MTQQEKIEFLKKTHVLQTGHFRLTSGRHSEQYMQCARIFEDARYAEPICKEIADAFKNKNIDLVIGPAVGGIIIAYEVSRQLGVRTIFAERENGAMTLRRGFYIEPGTRVLVVEDTITTGGSVKETIELAEKNGGIVVGVGSVVDRSGGMADFGVPLYAAIKIEMVSYDQTDCPLCKQGLPIIKPGSRSFNK